MSEKKNPIAVLRDAGAGKFFEGQSVDEFMSEVRGGEDDDQTERIAELERTVDDLRGELAQSDRASDAARIAELEAERAKLRAALERIVASKNCSIFSDCNRTETCLTLCYVSKIVREALKGGE